MLRIQRTQAAERQHVDEKEPELRAQTPAAAAVSPAVRPTDGVRRDARMRAAQEEANRRVAFEARRSDPNDRWNDAIAASRARRTAAAAGDTNLAVPPETRDVTRDPSPVNASTDADIHLANSELEQNREAERARLASLEEGAREDYQTVSAVTESDPVSRRALQEMLLDGRLDGEQGKNVLSEVAGLSRDEVAEGIERDALVQDLVQEIEDPSAISQQGVGTCVATTASIYLARTDPAEYARLVRGLASPEGKVTLKNGDEIRREDHTIDEDPSYDGAERSQSHRLLVPALMEYANPTSNYDPIDDSQQRDYGVFQRFDYQGLTNQDLDRVMEGLTGQTWDSHGSSGGEAELGRIDQATAKGQAVPASLDWGDGGHQVLVTDVTDDRVDYVNPWGSEESMSRAEFEERLTGVAYAPEA